MACALAGLPLGWHLRRELTTGGYRMEDEETGPLPRYSWLLVAGVPLAWGLLAWRLGGLADGAILPAFLAYAWAGVALFWIDADVHRLPHGLTWPLAGAVAGLHAVAAFVSRDWMILGRALACAGLMLVVYTVLFIVASGQFGMGDIILGTITGLLLGALSWRAPWDALAVGFVLAGLIALIRLALRQITLKSHIAFGPYIVLGALVIALAG